MVNSLDKHWKTVLFSFSGFGPNLLMIIMGAFFTDAINPAAMDPNSLQVINGTCLILPGIFPILWMLSKAFDGIVDIPLAAITDSLSTKWGRRRPAIAVCFIPMVISFVMCWIPFGDQTTYTVWVTFWALIFFTTYTMCMISYYGSFSNVCTNDRDRNRVSNYKSFFDTVTYCLTYALVPLLLEILNLHIHEFVLYISPLFLTILIPMFIIKEGEKYGYPERNGQVEKKLSMKRNIKLTLGNRIFRKWVVIDCCIFFGLQMFLVGMNALIIGGMGFSGAEMTIINTFAFAPVPIMLYVFNKIVNKKGLRFGLQASLLVFAISIMSFVFSSLYVTGGNKVMQYVIAITGSLLASFSIGTFFMLPYSIPMKVASVEEKITGVNHSAMYFAAQAFATAITGAIASGAVYENIKLLFIHKPTGEIVNALDVADAAAKMGVDPDQVFNFGLLIVPFVVAVMCMVGFFLAFKLPRRFSEEEIAREIKKTNPDADLSKIQEEVSDDRDSTGVNAFVWFLSMGIFGFVWSYFAIAKAEKATGGKFAALKWLCCLCIPWFGAIYLLKTHGMLKKALEKKGLGIKSKAIYVLSAVLFPILPMNIIALCMLTSDAQKLVD